MELCHGRCTVRKLCSDLSLIVYSALPPFPQEDEDEEAAPAADKADVPGPSSLPAAAAAAAGDGDGEGPSTSGREDAPSAEAAVAEGGGEPPSKRPKIGFGKLGKDPTVKTDFLPDKDRELLEEELRQQLRKVGLLASRAVRQECN